MKFNTKTWIRNQKTSLYLKSPGFKHKFSYIKASVIAILIGLLIGMIAVYLTGGNGWVYIQTMFTDAFSTFGSKTGNNFTMTMNYTTVFIFTGLGLALGFKVGLFNMGGSGQAVFGFCSTYLILRKIAENKNVGIGELPASSIIMVFLVFILCGVAVSVLTGILKVYFNIHEVATSIMLNWIIWYIMKWLVNQNNASVISQNWLGVGENTWIIGLVLALVSVVITWFVLGWTTFGYKFNMVGKQKTAAKYAGVNGNLYIIMVTAAQGLFISLGGIFYYYNVLKQQQFYSDMIPTIGFDAISVALVAFNNVIGVIPVAILWAIFNSAAPSAADSAYTAQELSYVISGVIMYSATIYVLFMQLKPWELLKEEVYLNKDVELKMLIGNNNKIIHDNQVLLKQVKTSEYILNLKADSNAKISSLKKQLIDAKAKYLANKKSTEWQEFLQAGILNIQNLKQELRNLKLETKLAIIAETRKQKKLLKNHLDKLMAVRKLNQKQITELKEQLLANKKSSNPDSKIIEALKKDIQILVGNKIMFKSAMIEHKTDYKHYMENFKDEQQNPITDLNFKIHNAKFEISKQAAYQEVLSLQNQIKITKDIFNEEVNNEMTKYLKNIHELKAENKELTEKGFNKYYNSGLFGIAKHFNTINRDNLIVVLNQAVIKESEVNLQIHEIKKSLKNKNSTITKDGAVTKILALKNELNSTFGARVQELKVNSQKTLEQKKAALAAAKSKIKAFKLDTKQALSTVKTKSEKNTIKQALFKKIEEVQNEYITISK